MLPSSRMNASPTVVAADGAVVDGRNLLAQPPVAATQQL